MKKTSYFKNIFFFILIIIIISYILYILYESIDHNSCNRTLRKDGYMVINDADNKNILKYLPKNYVFIDYKYEIKGCTLSTFHRDVTSSQYIYNTKYPVYTFIVYYNSGPLLSVIPKSHNTTPFSWDKSVIIHGNKGTGVLFNCDLVHAGAMNNFKEQRHAIQYKICHYDDLKTLSHLDGINKTTYKHCNNNKYYEYICRKLSMMFPFVFNHLFTSLLQDKPQKDTIFEYLVTNYYIGDFYNK
jgi:hypothetical protein